MDMTIQIKEGKIVTTLYAKPLALYEYIPPNSFHPPGVLTGLVHGQIFRIHCLCSKNSDIEKEIRLFFNRLIDRGYLRTKLLPLFEKGFDNATTYMSMTLDQRAARKKAKVGRSNERIFLHILYHPQNPPSESIQQLWRDLIYSPPGEKTLNQLKNHF